MRVLILLLGGVGKRSGLNVKKQFFEHKGIPLFIYSLRAVLALNCRKIIIVCADEDKDFVAEKLKKCDINTEVEFALNGKDRASSVFSGMTKAAEHKPDYVYIHDGVRPFVYEADLKRLAENTEKYGASILAAESTDSIKIIDEKGIIRDSPDRSSIYKALTPQGFVFDKYLWAMEKYFKQAEFSATDDASIFAMYAGDVYITKGSSSNIKITTADDVEMFKALLSTKGTS